MNDKQYVVLSGNREIYHQVSKPVNTWDLDQTICGLRLNFDWDTLFPGVPLNHRLCKHCERIATKLAGVK